MASLTELQSCSVGMEEAVALPVRLALRVKGNALLSRSTLKKTCSCKHCQPKQRIMRGFNMFNKLQTYCMFNTTFFLNDISREHTG